MKSIELFAGIGGIALAAEWAGVETVAFCEREPFCQKVLNKNFPGVPIFDDVCTLNRQLLEEKGVIKPGGTIDIISGGFPCQPYSIAGKRRGTEDDRDLWPEMFRIIKELRPTWVVGENVANFANMELDRTLSDLESAGYKGQSFIIPACAVDAKHRRDRTFVVAYSDHKRQPARGCKESAGRPVFSRHSNMADTHNEHLQRPGAEQQTAGFTGKGEVISDTSCERCDQVEQHDRGRKTSEKAVCQVGEYSLKPRGGESRWATEPDVGRVAHGVPDRVDRIKGLGNAVVPQQIYPIFRFLREFHS
ncbi:DNA (cytosine-5-)-methyltransferase [Bacillus velezensis]|uniref:DNA cytosine methyltransferase n=1 Tax=Bacillus velezensis TaxID=492670 RepID=UPI0029E7EA45|nr:DNA (cytosine-5-)-methyltransferase [Bacillus velezensis]MDX7984822.1 DNA (cytosine-5-)-methyltransferase [Bacillus velezensis]